MLKKLIILCLFFEVSVFAITEREESLVNIVNAASAQRDVYRELFNSETKILLNAFDYNSTAAYSYAKKVMDLRNSSAKKINKLRADIVAKIGAAERCFETSPDPSARTDTEQGLIDVANAILKQRDAYRELFDSETKLLEIAFDYNSPDIAYSYAKKVMDLRISSAKKINKLRADVVAKIEAVN